MLGGARLNSFHRRAPVQAGSPDDIPLDELARRIFTQELLQFAVGPVSCVVCIDGSVTCGLERIDDRVSPDAFRCAAVTLGSLAISLGSLMVIPGLLKVIAGSLMVIRGSLAMIAGLFGVIAGSLSMIHRSLIVIRGSVGVIPGLLGVIRGLLGVIAGTFEVILRT